MTDQKFSTHITKDRNGWNATTEVDLPEIGGNFLLKLLTYKRTSSGSLTTTATVWQKTGDGGLSHRFGFGAMGGDYECTVTISRPIRITEKLVREQHDLGLLAMNVIRTNAQTFYEGQKAHLVNQKTQFEASPLKVEA